MFKMVSTKQQEFTHILFLKPRYIVHVVTWLSFIVNVKKSKENQDLPVAFTSGISYGKVII